MFFCTFLIVFSFVFSSSQGSFHNYCRRAQTSKQNVAKHLKRIFEQGELQEESVVNQWLTTAADGKNYSVAYYNLDAIISVGYRVNSIRGTQFRIWATQQLSELMRKGFVLDKERVRVQDRGNKKVPPHR